MSENPGPLCLGWSLLALLHGCLKPFFLVGAELLMRQQEDAGDGSLVDVCAAVRVTPIEQWCTFGDRGQKNVSYVVR